MRRFSESTFVIVIMKFILGTVDRGLNQLGPYFLFWQLKAEELIKSYNTHIRTN